MSDTATAAPSVNAAAVERLAARLRNPLQLRGFFLTKLPLAYMAGLRVTALDAHRCSVTVPYGWRTTNPFKSTYFAAQAMAAELATGSLVMLAVQTAPAPVAMLIVGMSATFQKKASDTLTFTCTAGDAAFAAVRETLRTGEGVPVEMEVVGTLPDGAVAATFTFTWSVKKRASRP
ncbi:MAG TPA: DUF4442 domain-containing protein [Longimicrobiaceae bacterium]|nr:DUF4442 domain-containing protein [Longimicrobiaceae bacterium]